MKHILLFTILFLTYASIFAQVNSSQQVVIKHSLGEAPPPPPKPKVEDVFKVVENMPRFPGCEHMGGTNAEKKECADRKMLEFIYKNVEYPPAAKERGVEGTCVVKFVVEKDGSISDIEVVRDIGYGCGAESARVVGLMNTKSLKWIPTCSCRGRNVRVQFNLPVKFKLP